MKITRGMCREPLAVLLYGTPGVGKSTFASSAEDAIFVGPETNPELDISRFEQTKTYADVMNCLKKIKTGKHQFKTLVIDSISGIERIIHNDILKNEPDKSMATVMGAYGKGYEEAAKHLWKIREELEDIRLSKNMNVVVIGHAMKRPFTDPLLQTEYDVYEMSLHKSKTKDCNAFFVEWASMMLFLNWSAHKTSDKKFAGAVGKREMLTEHRPSHYAKNRVNLPYKIELTDKKGWNIIQKYVEDFYAGGTEDFKILADEYKDVQCQLTDEKKIVEAGSYYDKCIKLVKDRPRDAYNMLEKGVVRLKEIKGEQKK